MSTLLENSINSDSIQKIEGIIEKFAGASALLTDRDTTTKLTAPELAIVDAVYHINPLKKIKKMRSINKFDIANLRKCPDYLCEDARRIFVPSELLSILEVMNDAFLSEHGNGLQLSSGFRSTEYQAIVFLRFLRSYQYNLKHTVAHVAVPGYSEHNDPSHTAIDFSVQVADEDFDSTREFRWLKKHASEYCLDLSFSKSNVYGIKYEPWHWRYTG